MNSAIESLPLAFGFTNLAMLGWLAAAAAPLVIHLWNRRKFRETRWAAVAFLLAAMRKNARRIQIQQWLLLAVRTAIIALVVLAVAEPYGERLAAGTSSATPTHKVLVLDGSFSMAYRPQDGSLWQQARKLAAELVTGSGSGDVFTVIELGARPRTVLDREPIDRAAVAARIEALPQTHGRADLPAGLTLVQQALQRQQGDRIERQEVYFFTDVQRATWQLRNADCGLRIRELSGQATLVVVDVGRPGAANLAVTRLAAADPFVVAGREAAFEATVHEFGNQPRSGCVIEFLVDGVPVGQQTVDIPAGGEKSVRFTHRFVEPGRHTVAVRTSGDRLEVDNTRRLVAEVRDAVRVLCVAGRQGAARYVADALDPDPHDDSALRPVVASEGDLAELDLAPYDCVFLCNVAQLSAGEAERLRRYAEQGGGVVFFLGDQVLADRYNALAEGKQPLVPARLGELVTESPPVLDPLDYRHPIVAPFRARERAGLLSTPIARYFRLVVPPQRSGVKVALAAADGDPLIVTAPVGRGRVALIATAGSLASVDVASGQPWTLWPTWPSFLPIVRELAAYAMSGQSTEWQQTVGRPLTGSIAEATPGEVVEITRPDGWTDPVTVSHTADGWQWVYDDTDVSGFYTARTEGDSPIFSNDVYTGDGANTREKGTAPGASQQFAVNVDPAESDLARVDPGGLPSELALHHESPNAVAAPTGGIVSRAAWHVDLLWAALLLVLFELWLAWRFGRGVI